MSMPASVPLAAALTARRTGSIGPCAALAVMALAASAATAQTGDPARLPDVLVTAPSADHRVRRTPHSVSVITEAAITRSPATSLTELLSLEANLNLQSFYGNDKNASIDIRGMGATAGSNVLVLVDGIRLNELDLSGADLSSVPMSQIERIEIVRGGGAVRYGDGAVAGVINIITRRATPGATTAQAALSLEQARGSYGMRDGRAHLRASAGALGLSLNLSESDTDGYRRNARMYSRNSAAELRAVAPPGLEFLEAWVRVSDHADRNGFPGPVSAADFAAGSAARRATSTPDDHGDTRDTLHAAGLFADLERAGQLEMQFSYRDRVNNYVLGYAPLTPLADQQSTITSQRHEVQLRYDNDFQAFGQTHTIGAGFQSQSGQYARYSNGRSVPEQSEQKIGSVRSHGSYLTATVRASRALAINAGIRSNRFTTALSDARYTRSCAFAPFPVRVCTPYAFAPQGGSDGHWRNRGTELGLTWDVTPELTAFASRTRHFRNPNLDELAAAAADLRPQSGRTHELGARWTPHAPFALSATVFEMRNKDEIHYGVDPASGLSENRNYERATRRTGAELEARWQATPQLGLSANLGYVVPRFEGSDADIPLVPRVTASVQVQWKLDTRSRWSVALRHVGKRYDGNDVGNRLWPQLPAYTVVDALWQLDLGQAELSLGVNNLFNRAYSTLGYSASYYPMPERAVHARLRVSW